MKDPAGPKKVMCRVGNRLSDRTEAERLRSGNSAEIDNRLLVEKILVEGQQETGALAVSHRPRDRAFIILPALRRLDGGEGIARVEDRVAKHEIQRAVIVWRSALGNDFQSGAPRAREAGGVRVV